LKVSILTIIGIENYGSLLQAIATQKKMEEYADDVLFINYIHNSRYTDLSRNIKNPLKKPFRVLRMVLYNRNFRMLKDTYIRLSKEVYTCGRDFENFQDDADIYCTGSDQIWNPSTVRHMPLGLRFLEFIPEGKRRFAFASSFGLESMDEKIVAQSREWIRRFQRISVREDSGVRILTEQYGYDDPIQLVDPTMAVPPEYWRSCAAKPGIKKDYILIYAVYIDKAFDEYAKKLSKKMGLPLVRLCPDIHQALRCGKSLIIPPVFSFITLIDNAKYVLTDSLHATAFSMSLNTEPICVCFKNPGRIASFLRLIGQEHRMISDFSDFDVLSRPVDFEHVNTILARERERVDEFLRCVFNSQRKEFG